MIGPGEVPSLCPGGMRSGRKGRRSESSGGRGGPEGAGWKGESSGSCIHVCFASLFSHIIPTLMYPLVSVLTKYVSSSMRSAWASTIMVRVVGAPSGAHLLPPPCCTLLRSSHLPYQIPPLSFWCISMGMDVALVSLFELLPFITILTVLLSFLREGVH